MSKPSSTAKSDARRLGRGLAALLGDDALSHDGRASAATLPLADLSPCARNPRRDFDERALAELAQSIRARGVLQPILVRRHPDRPGKREILAGERRWRAARQAGLHEVPIREIEADDRQCLEIALAENIQRSDLSPLEEAQGYRRLIDDFGHTQEKIGEIVGRSRAHIANTLRLLGLPDKVRDMLASGALTAGHARALLSANAPLALAARTAAENLSVRDVEKLVRREAEDEAGRHDGRRSRRRGAHDDDALSRSERLDIARIEKTLADGLGLKVTLTPGDREDSGRLTLHYSSRSQLDAVLSLLRREGRRAD